MANKLTDKQREAVVTMIRDGYSRQDIAARTGLKVRSIDSIRANHTMGKYPFPLNQAKDDLLPSEEAEEVAVALETKFGLERDLQNALRSHIEQLEPGLRISDGGTEQAVASGGRIDITAE